MQRPFGIIAARLENPQARGGFELLIVLIVLIVLIGLVPMIGANIASSRRARSHSVERSMSEGDREPR